MHVSDQPGGGMGGDDHGALFQDLRKMLEVHQEKQQKQQVIHDDALRRSPADLDDEDDDTQNLVYSIPVDHEGTAVYVKGWAKLNTPYPPLVIVHDLGENIGLYRRAAKKLGEEGFSVFGFDLRGHGRSGRLLGHIPHFNSLVNDLLQVVAWIRFKSNRRIPMIIGQGMGALITVYFQKSYPELVRGSVLIAPVLNHKLRISFFHRMLVRGLAEVMPRSRLPRSLVPRFIATVPQVETLNQGSYHGITSNFAKELINAVSLVGHAFSQYGAPSLILTPDHEAGYDFKDLHQIIQAHAYPEKFQSHQIPGIGLQPLTSDPEQLDAVLQFMIPWLHQQFRDDTNLTQTKS